MTPDQLGELFQKITNQRGFDQDEEILLLINKQEWEAILDGLAILSGLRRVTK